MVRFLLISAVVALGAGCAVEPSAGVEEVATSEQPLTFGYGWPNCSNISNATLDPDAESDGAWTGYKSQCVSHRVELNVPGGEGSWVSAEVIARFPEHTGAWTQENIDKCRNSFVRVWYAQEEDADSPTNPLPQRVDVHGEPDFYADGYTYRIEGCTATWRRTPHCGWNVKNHEDFVRVDAVTFSNGVRSNNPLYSSMTKYEFCGSL